MSNVSDNAQRTISQLKETAAKNENFRKNASKANNLNTKEQKALVKAEEKQRLKEEVDEGPLTNKSPQVSDRGPLLPYPCDYD